MPSIEQVVEQVNSLGSNWGAQVRPDHIFIRCPWHKKGRERTPSLRINLNGLAAPVGAFNCFGCEQKGNWNKLAQELKLLTFDRGYQSDIPEISKQLDRELLEVEDAVLPEGFEWPGEKPWRGISGDLLATLGCLHYYDWDVQAPCLYLPVNVHQQLLGGVRCLINAANGSIPKYRNTPGRWARRALFPYDQVGQINSRMLVLVEGPRDALNLLQYGVPAVCNFGSYAVWSPDKAELLLNLEPELVVLAFDPDEAGIQASRKISRELKAWVPVKRLRLPQGRDPGDLSESEVLRLKRSLSETRST